ncbi:protein disulfide-isomerase [Malassezia cuniculi]|uniref:Protein disulfide-isomerase n=1 Tax=Malassezia cuniculi TaxID=948313 RepID=A0AAF0J7E5_9BASI|nr:protein disulfide-isomerase [Malassezia cuniculi]
MRTSFALVISAFAAVAHAALFASKGPVLELTGKNFDSEVRSIEKPTFVAFTAPWCGHCQRLAPEYSRAAAKLDGTVKFAYIDCENSASKNLCAEFGIKGFPTIKVFPATKKRIPRDYMGERSAQALIDHAVDTLPLSAVRKIDTNDVKTFVEKHAAKAPVFVLFSNKARSSAMYRAVALDHRSNGAFAFVNAGREGVSAAAIEAAQEIGASLESTPALFAISNWDGAKGAVEQYKGSMKYKEITAWAATIVSGGSGKAKPAKKAADKKAADKKTTKKASSKAASEAAKDDKPQAEAFMSEERLAEEVRKIMDRARAGELEGDAGSGMLELVDQMRELINHEWSQQLHEKSELSKTEAIRAVREPEHADEAIALAENHLRDGFLHELKLINNRLKTKKDENGRPLPPGTVTKEEAKLDLVNRILDTLRRRAAERGDPISIQRETQDEDSFDIHDEL